MRVILQRHASLEVIGRAFFSGCWRFESPCRPTRLGGRRLTSFSVLRDSLTRPCAEL